MDYDLINLVIKVDTCINFEISLYRFIILYLFLMFYTLFSKLYNVVKTEKNPQRIRLNPYEYKKL